MNRRIVLRYSTLGLVALVALVAAAYHLHDLDLTGLGGFGGLAILPLVTPDAGAKPSTDPQVKALMVAARTAYEQGDRIRKKAVAENRDMTAEEQEQCVAAFDVALEKKGLADKLVKAAELGAFLSDPNPQTPAGDGNSTQRKAWDDPDADPFTLPGALPAERKSWEPGLRRYRSPADDVPPEILNRAWKKYVLRGGSQGGIEHLTDVERKALGSLYDVDGGWAVRSETSNEVIQRMRDEAEIINMVSRKFTSARSIGFPVLDFSGSVDAVAEKGTVQELVWADILGRTNFTPVARAKMFKMPRDWLEDSAMDMESTLVDFLSTIFVETMEQDVVSGDGKKGPLGLYSAPFNTVETTNASIVLTPEDVKGLPFEIKKQYRRGAGYVMTRATLKQIMLLRDASGGAGTGQFLWQQGLQAGQPDRLCGYPSLESEYAPAFANVAGSPALLFGDMRWYWLVIRRELTIQRLVELYAATREIGILMDMRYDGAPVLKDPFIKLVRKA